MVNNLYVQVVKLGIVFCLLLSYKIIIVSFSCRSQNYQLFRDTYNISLVTHTPRKNNNNISSLSGLQRKGQLKMCVFIIMSLCISHISNLFIEKVKDIVVIFHTFYGPKPFSLLFHSWRKKESSARAGFFSLQGSVYFDVKRFS